MVPLSSGTIPGSPRGPADLHPSGTPACIWSQFCLISKLNLLKLEQHPAACEQCLYDWGPSPCVPDVGDVVCDSLNERCWQSQNLSQVWGVPSAFALLLTSIGDSQPWWWLDCNWFLAAVRIQVSKSTAGILLAWGGYDLQKKGTIPVKVRPGPQWTPVPTCVPGGDVKKLDGMSESPCPGSWRPLRST